jgi:tetratricopeptide (TPR) repeat protein
MKPLSSTCLLVFGTITTLLFSYRAMPQAQDSGSITPRQTTSGEPTNKEHGNRLIRVIVTDLEKNPLGGVTVTLTNKNTGERLEGSTSIEGTCDFHSLVDYEYSIRLSLSGWHEVRENGWPKFGERSAFNRAMFVRLQMEQDKDNSLAKYLPEYSDSPTFTVSGVTDPTNLGGHGSDVVLRTKESLAKDAALLNSTNIVEERERLFKLEGGPIANNQEMARWYSMHGDIAESDGHPLEAVRNYQVAAELDPTEANIFAWGAELLLHRAYDPAADVFTRGNQFFPKSSRILIGLGVTSYARGMADEAAQQLSESCDVNPADPTPYVFLGKMQNAEKTEPAGWTERLRRFVQLHPENALAHYYYAVALTKSGDAADRSDAIESSLLKAIELDPHLGDAYLQLGIFYAQRKDFAKAEASYEKAIVNTPLPDEAHFRLAEAYRLTGDRAKAHDEIAQYEKISKQKTQANEQERHEIQQFVYTLRGSANSSTTPPPATAKPQ